MKAYIQLLALVFLGSSALTYGCAGGFAPFEVRNDTPYTVTFKAKSDGIKVAVPQGAYVTVASLCQKGEVSSGEWEITIEDNEGGKIKDKVYVGLAPAKWGNYNIFGQLLSQNSVVVMVFGVKAILWGTSWQGVKDVKEVVVKLSNGKAVKLLAEAIFESGYRKGKIYIQLP